MRRFTGWIQMAAGMLLIACGLAIFYAIGPSQNPTFWFALGLFLTGAFLVTTAEEDD